MSFRNTFAYFTQQAVVNEDAALGLASLGVTPKFWPECAAKTVLTKFLVDLEGHGFHYASWQAAKSILFEQLEEEARGIHMPGDPALVRIEYDKALKGARLEKLLQSLSKTDLDPDLAVREFLEGQAAGIEVVSFAESVEWFEEHNAAAILAGEALVIIPDWPILSESIGGFNPGRLGVLVADTGFGKTLISCQLAISSAQDFPVLYVNMEMTRADFTQRLIASVTHTEHKKFATGEWDKRRAREIASRRPIHFTTGQDMSPLAIQALARRYADKHKIKMLVVDYDQKLILSGRDEEWRELQRAAIFLESIAKELNIYVLLLAQSNHDGGISGSKRSMFPASTVMYFGREEDGECRTYIRTLKNRFGPRNSMVVVDYQPQYSLVAEKEKSIWIGKPSGARRSLPR